MRIAKEVVCLTYRKWYPSISYASKVTRTDKDNIAKACKKVIEHTVNLEGTKLKWMFKDEFIEVYGEDNFWNLHRATQDFYTNDMEEEWWKQL